MTRYTPKEKNMTTSTNNEREEIPGAIRYINFSGDYDNFEKWKEKTKAITRHKGILEYLTKEVEIPTEYEAENYEEK